MNTAKYWNTSSGGTYIEDVVIVSRREWTEDDITLLEKSFGFQDGKRPVWMYTIISEGEEIEVSDKYIELPTFVGAV